MKTMPVLFVGHGSPMNAIEENEFRRGWTEIGRTIPKPRAVLCISAHWETPGVFATSSDRPETIHDFYGFPEELFAVRYPAPGDPDLAREVARIVTSTEVRLDEERGLDHGCWSVLTAMYPAADVPVVQLSLAHDQPAPFHYELGKELAPFRERGVLLIGSGDIVHNLRLVNFGRKGGYDWAVRFDAEVRTKILEGDHDSLVDYGRLGPDTARAVPTPEHYLPLLYVLALQRDTDDLFFFNEKVALGSISMTSFVAAASTARSG